MMLIHDIITSTRQEAARECIDVLFWESDNGTDYIITTIKEKFKLEG